MKQTIWNTVKKYCKRYFIDALSAMALAAELFGGQGLLPFAIMIAVGYALSGRSSLYESQRRADVCPAPDA